MPARCGDTNERIDFVLSTFGVQAPRFIANVSPVISDVMQRQILSVTPQATAAEALHMMDNRSIRILPVLDEGRRCCGLLSLFKLTKFLFPSANRQSDSRRILSSLENLAQTLQGKLLVSFEPKREEDLIMVIGAMAVDSFAARIEAFPREKLIVVVGDRLDIQKAALRERVRVLIVTGGLGIEGQIIEAAERNGVSIISSPHDTAATAALCRAAVTVRHVLNEEFVCFREGETLSVARDVARASGHQVFPVLDVEGKVAGIFSKADFLKTAARKLILVDHNELSQAVQGAEEAEIIEIIDHHRIGALSTLQPILFRNEPVGSTCTIVADCFFRSGVELPPPTAGLLLAGLVSDTLNLTSPTSTPFDAEILKKLELLSNVNATRFTENLFACGSLLNLRAAPQAITTDCKEYIQDAVKFSVAQIEEIGFDQFWKKKNELLRALEMYRGARSYFFSGLLVTDVVNQSSLLLVVGDQQFIKRIDYPRLEPGVYELRDVVSRKKQLLPYFTHCLRQEAAVEVTSRFLQI